MTGMGVRVSGRRFRLWRGGVMAVVTAAMAGMAGMVHRRGFGLMMAFMAGVTLMVGMVHGAGAH